MTPEQQVTIKSIIDADAPHWARRQANEAADEILEKEGVLAAVQKGGMAKDPAPMEWVGGLFDAVIALAKRVRVLEERPAALDYRGVWKEGETYPANVFVTRDGSLWHSKAANISRKPGTEAGASAWTLAVKRGADGRNAPEGQP